MLKNLLKLHRDYQDAKQNAAEHTFSVFESKTGSLYFIFFSALTILFWSIAIFSLDWLELQYNVFGFFIISYFFIFLGSKLIFKPTAEELSDDTSLFALFSACSRRERRSLISIGLAVLHTLIFALYLVGQNITQF